MPATTARRWASICQPRQSGRRQHADRTATSTHGATSPVTCDLAVIKDAQGRSCGVPDEEQARPGYAEKGRVLKAVHARGAHRYGLCDHGGQRRGVGCRLVHALVGRLRRRLRRASTPRGHAMARTTARSRKFKPVRGGSVVLGRTVCERHQPTQPPRRQRPSRTTITSASAAPRRSTRQKAADRSGQSGRRTASHAADATV